MTMKSDLRIKPALSEGLSTLSFLVLLTHPVFILMAIYSPSWLGLILLETATQPVAALTLYFLSFYTGNTMLQLCRRGY